MPVNPGDGELYAARVARLLDQAELDLLRLMSDLLATDPTSVTWQADRLRHMQVLVEQARRTGAVLEPRVRQEILDVVMDAYNTGAALSLPDLDRLGIPPAPGAGAAVAAAEAATARVMPYVRASLDKVADLLQAVYVEAVNAGAAEVLGGRLTRLQASQQVLDRLLADGIRGFTDKAGRNWSLETYVEMAVRTTTGQAAVQGHLDQLQAVGIDLVRVSDAPRECPLCRPWENKVLSLSGQVGAVILPNATGGAPVHVTVAGTVEQARASGLQHPNCRHSLSAFVPGATTIEPAKGDPEGYDAGQRQREMERRIRHWKRRQALALDDAAAKEAGRKVRQWQGALREHVDTHNLKRLTRRERVGPPGTHLAR